MNNEKEVPCKNCILFAICKSKVIDLSNDENFMHMASRYILEKNCEILYNFIKNEGYAFGYVELELAKLFNHSFRLSIRVQIERHQITY